MTSRIHSNLEPDAVLLRQIGEEMFGPTWQADLSHAIAVSDRSMRRWAAGTDPVPEGVWRDIHLVAEAKWVPIKYFDDEIVARLDRPERLSAIPNTIPKRAHLGLHFALHTDRGRTVRCFISRAVLDDRVPRYPLEVTQHYFKEHAEAFIRVAERKWNAGDVQDDLITINEGDVSGENLPDIRNRVFADPAEPAVLRYEDVRVDCPTLQEAILAWHRLDGNQKAYATVSTRDGGLYKGAAIGEIYARE